MLGNGRLEVQGFDGTKRLALIRGKMRKKVWIQSGDIILLSLRDYQDEKCDVFHKYNPDEARQLKKIGELPSNIQINENQEQVSKPGVEVERVSPEAESLKAMFPDFDTTIM